MVGADVVVCDTSGVVGDEETESMACLEEGKKGVGERGTGHCGAWEVGDYTQEEFGRYGG